MRLTDIHLDRRAFLGFSAASSLAGIVSAQVPPVVPGAQAAPAKAKITSSVMLWTLPGDFDQKVRTAALAGMQSVGLNDEYVTWDFTEKRRAKRYVESFGMSIITVAARAGLVLEPSQGAVLLGQINLAIDAAKQIGAPYVMLTSGNEISGRSREEQYASLAESLKQASALAARTEVTLLLAPLKHKVDHPGAFLSTAAEGLRLVKEVDHPSLQLLFSVYEEQVQTGSVLPALKDALEHTAMVLISEAPGRGEPGTGAINFKEIYRTLQKSGYSHVVGMEYKPQGDAVASLKRTVDQFRAVVNERAMPAAVTEGSLV